MNPIVESAKNHLKQKGISRASFLENDGKKPKNDMSICLKTFMTENPKATAVEEIHNHPQLTPKMVTHDESTRLVCLPTFISSSLYGELSHEKNPPTFHYTGWLIGILIMVYYNLYRTG